MKYLPGCLSFFYVLLSFPLHAQEIFKITDPLAQKMEWYGVKKKPSALFVHFDKNIYTSNEHVWFTAYLIEAKRSLQEHHTLVVSLVRNDDSLVLTDQKFVMEKGLSYGNLILPDSLMPGHYSLLVYTNLLADGQPVTSFFQPITIKSEAEPGFIASLKLAEKITADSDSAKLTFKASSKDIHTLVSFADINYSLGNGVKQIKRKLKTDVYGGLDFKVPVRQLDAGNNRLLLQASFRNEIKKLQLTLPVPRNNAIVKFFPEGGTLREGNRTQIGWEVKDAYGEPLQISGILYKNEEAVDTLQTNGYGLGSFSLIPETGYNYYVILAKSDQEKISYSLPKATLQGPTIFVANAVCNDTLVLRVQDRIPGMFYAMIHNYTEVFLSFPLNMSVTSVRTFRVPLTSVPKGIYTLTLMDSLGRPVAERLFFAHYNARTELQIKTDQAEYATRKKVNLSLQLRDVFGNPVKGLVSVACVQNNRIDPRKMTDIESYTYLNNVLSSVPFKRDPLGNESDNLDYWENILLVKGWRRYTWPDLLQTKADDTLQKFSSLLFTGVVTRNEKKVTRPYTLTAFSDSSFHTILTDSSGHFIFKNEDLILSPDKKKYLFLNDKNKEAYTVQVDDPYRNLTGTLAHQLVYENFDAGSFERNTETMLVKPGEKATVLKEVIVTDKKDRSISGTAGRNECGDYVCLYNVLNCPNHPYGTMPVEGKSYRTGGGSMTYQGCVLAKKENKFMIYFKGIYQAKEFYQEDYATISPSAQMYLSTIFWNHSVSVNSDKATKLSFYTSDIVGKYRVVVQGVTTGGVVHGEYVFNVVK
ncbi:MAG: hypothetical protein V4557_02000 [Bacteroidota bacterium]